MSNCPLSADGVHRGMKCACGSEMIIPRFCVSIEVIDHSETLVSEGFNCDDLRVAQTTRLSRERPPGLTGA